MVILHIDVNNAFLSWTAVAMLKEGCAVDLRTVPSVIGGDPKSRHGIVLAKSPRCKEAGIVTGESLFEAKRKCPELLVVPPDHALYKKYSDEMYALLCEYSPIIQRFSIDECFLDYTQSESRFGDPVSVANQIRERMKNELGFTVNIGIASTMLLAKMASEFEKPDKVHTLWPDEIETKLWPLPVRNLFMVGKASEQKLRKININTIGELAKTDPHYLKTILKAHGILLWEYANGIDSSQVIPGSEVEQKSIGNSTTTAYDIIDRREAHKILLSLCERVGMRLRSTGSKAALVSVNLKTADFVSYSHQIQLQRSIDGTSDIYRNAKELFDQCWKKEPLRLLGVSVADLCTEEEQQISFFDEEDSGKGSQLDKTVDLIRRKYGEGAIMRGTFADGEIPPLTGSGREE